MDRAAAGGAQRVELQRGRLFIRGDARVADQAQFGDRGRPGESSSRAKCAPRAFFAAVFGRFGAAAGLATSVDAGATAPP